MNREPPRRLPETPPVPRDSVIPFVSTDKRAGGFPRYDVLPLTLSPIISFLFRSLSVVSPSQR